MFHRFLATALLGSALLSGCAPLPTAQDVSALEASVQSQTSLAEAVADPRRTATNIARDRYRHPLETLSFFGVEPDDTVVEIWPAGGWYTEILAPYLSGRGRLILATSDGQLGGVSKLRDAHPALYRSVTTGVFPAFDASAARVPDSSADVVLTFRNVHNWRMGARHPQKQDYSADAFRQMFAMLKPGGVLGVVDHRLPESASLERETKSGYMKVSTVRRLAEQAGFSFAGASEINANPLDTADWPSGVWTLPPNYALKDQDRARYQAIGESDRMTLKFVKPR